ncbi:TIGR03986 family CRISPR-associated RAMP protein [Streptomyces sp. P9(2023)]|uniref:TIGR03986 family type III CRISPR-associated RAMP protein n=1 Tax=Streptomyces sp. P9(2023) TaxID=3064394 RepID=UPI0028F3FF58|nr:TIGR03986 family CRISPR-associated RAMP protein [Streptomyces sp. P9(2023)]MDT9692649.1 TIGR03986 family CRISPR-associated RAMP protein [Streptomyces sp. P9(2023)]
MKRPVPPPARSEGEFINPYTFVPLPVVADQVLFARPAAGHSALEAGRYQGEIEVELTALAPLLVRGAREGDQVEGVQRFPRRAFPTDGLADPVPYLPGSSLAGVVRSLHELIAGGCLRVFKDDFLPVYRDRPKSRPSEWRMATVDAVDEEGRPTRFTVCASERRRVAIDALLKAKGGLPETGDRITFGADARTVNEYGKTTVSGGAIRWSESGDWVLLLTHAGTRDARDTYYAYAGHLGPGSYDAYGVTDAAWDEYQSAVAGANDVRESRKPEEGRKGQDPLTAEVRPGEEPGLDPIGVRHKALPHLRRGQVVWVRAEPPGTPGRPRVTALALSQIWRHTATGQPSGQRVPEQLLPCRDPQELCPTCRIFGSADTRGKDDPDDRAAHQYSYRGHIRFSDARPLGAPPFETREYSLAPLGSPRPGAGQFYLRPNNLQPRRDETPLREWGSRADDGEPRQLRGRKQYWLTGRSSRRPFFRADSNATWTENKDMQQRAEAVPPGSRFAYTVRFEGLDLSELGGLLSALDPAGLLPGDTGFAVGGGRPLGFGACTSRVRTVRAYTAEQWYAGAGRRQSVVEPQAALAAFRAQVDAGVRQTWSDVQAALTVDHVAPDNVWYPVDARIPDGKLTPNDLEPGFTFWAESVGEQLSDRRRDLRSLPRPSTAAHTLPVVSEPSKPKKKGRR